MDVYPRVVHRRRDTITALPLYHSGYLLKRNTGETDFKKYYGELRGATVFLYTDDTQYTYIEKLDLEKLKSMDLGVQHKGVKETVFTLPLQGQEVQLKVEMRGEWRGFILTVIKKEIPAHLQLLPGQRVRLEDALTQERRRRAPQSRPPLPPPSPYLPPAIPPASNSPSPSTSPSSLYSPSPSNYPSPSSLYSPPPSSLPCPSPAPPEARDTLESSYSMIPACFHNVTREEAERMLEANPEWGSIILRPSTLQNSYALSLRQLAASGPKMKHYRVTSTKSGFVIELDRAVVVSSLDEVVKYCMEQTEYRLHPYMQAWAYNTHIEVPPAANWISCSPTAAKLVPKARVAPMPTSPPIATEEDGYVVPCDHRVKSGVKE
ncbi:signal-transducing adaptor protein 1-like [Genypterus blacodes]|uniref:signal-transducing adaptor protein 1-like n=1 Tax=Genypterus blacodes TaxID=154954 RepID=UPI003F770617